MLRWKFSQQRGPGVAISDAHSGEVRRRKGLAIAFWMILGSGMILRVVAGTQSLGFVHPDEHQQYLEAAQRIVYGYGAMYWEYERGVRHYLYPGLLAGVLWGLEAVGVSEPVRQAMFIRVLMGTTVFAAIALVARDWMRRKTAVAGLGLLCMAAWSPDMVFIGARTLSETAMLVPLMLGILFLDRKPSLAGICFGLMFAVRFQSAFFTAGFLLVALIDDVAQRRLWRQATVGRMVIGLAGAMVVVGLIDWATWGSWFHSPIEYFRANLLEGKAASFGVEPWYRYLEWSWDALLDVSILLIPVVVVGALCEPRLAVAAIIFFLAHSAIGHKEARFLWPAVPIVLCLAATGLGAVWKWLEKPELQWGMAGLVAVNLLLGGWACFDRIDWHQEPTKSVSLALARVGEYSDVKGVAVYGVHEVRCGNYFFLRKNVPYVAHFDAGVILRYPKWRDGTINYLVARSGDVSPFKDSRLKEVGRVGDMYIYRVDSLHGR